jgi:hypothetical protein
MAGHPGLLVVFRLVKAKGVCRCDLPVLLLGVA